MKTWQVERIVHGAWLLTAAAFQHRAHLAAGDWRAALPTLLFIAALSAFAGVGSITDRLRERLDVECVALPTVECAAKLPRYLTAGRVLMVAFALSISGWVSLASLAWDCAFPYWRRWYRARHPARFAPPES